MKNTRAFVATNLIIILLFAVIYHRVQGFNKPLTFQDALYFSAVTHTTLGYGDIYPETAAARTLCSTHSVGMFCSTTAWALR